MADGDLLGEVRLFPYNFVPRGWIGCNGQVLPIALHTALHSIIGTAWGGDGITTFGIPNLNGHAVMHPSDQHPSLGQVVGSETVTLTMENLPAHSHSLQRKQVVTVTTKTPGPLPSSQFAQLHVVKPNGSTAITSHLVANGTPDRTMHPSAISFAGGGQPHPNAQPRLTLIYAICADGMFPMFE